jgi:hypothetical protein
MPRLTPEFFDADIGRGLTNLGYVGGQIVGDMARHQAALAAAKAQAEEKIREAEQTTQANELLTNASTALTQAEAELRGTTDHTTIWRNLRSEPSRSARYQRGRQGCARKAPRG